MQKSPLALHMPDGFLSTPVAIVGWILAILLVGYALRQVNRTLGERQVPVLGVLAAFIFVAQAINFPVAAGTSGHLLGGAFAAILMGPWAASLIMTAVIATQAVLFQDGGLIVMGWNIINMGVITSFTGYAAYRLVIRIIGDRTGAQLSGAFFSAWLSIVIGALATAVELAISGTIPLRLALPAMASIHIIIGIGEAIITFGAVSLLNAFRPDMLTSLEVAPGRRGAFFVVSGITIALLTALLLPLASKSPDGLESVATAGGFLQLGEEPVYEIFADYTVPLAENETIGTLLAVGVGTIIVFIVSILIGTRFTRPQQIRK